jgi:hypothetical protein
MGPRRGQDRQSVILVIFVVSDRPRWHPASFILPSRCCGQPIAGVDLDRRSAPNAYDRPFVAVVGVRPPADSMGFPGAAVIVAG